MNSTLPTPAQPIRLALIGAGQRSENIYQPLWPSLKPWCVPVAVCDPVAANGQKMATALGVPYYADIRQLVKDRPMEAALVVTPVPSHHSISVFLSSNGIHNHTETSWASMVCQAKDMIAVAKKHKVIVRVAENFLRMPIDRIVKRVAATGFLGPIRRIVSYAGHTGFHNNSRWIAFAGCHPRWVQCLEHTMPTVTFLSTRQRSHASETYRLHAFMFPRDLLVVDHAANIKGFLGRLGRPGHTEWQGESGTIVYSPARSWEGKAEVRYLRPEDREHALDDVDHTHPLAAAPVEDEYERRSWVRSFVDLPVGRIEHVNPFRPASPSNHRSHWYGVAVMDHIVDFSLAVRGLAKSEFDDLDALASMMMEAGAQESALQEGRRVKLPLEGDLESDTRTSEAQRKQFGCDPLDVESMLSVSFPRP